MRWDDAGPDEVNVSFADDEKLVAEYERLLAKCSELNEKFKSMSEDTRIQWEIKGTFRKTVYYPAMQEFREIDHKMKSRTEELEVQAIEHELKTKIGSMSAAARFVLMGILINHGLKDNYWGLIGQDHMIKG